MELYQLKYFLYAAKYENISKAAQALRVSQPSISRAVASLETDPPDPGRTDLPGADLPHFVEAGGAGRRDEKGAEGRGYDTS